jgi:hypothetical protein
MHLVMQHSPYDVSLATTTMEETAQGRDHQPKPTPHLMVEEICGHQHVQVETDKLPPGHSLLAHGGRWDAMTVQD